jgi:hypothetical protein
MELDDLQKQDYEVIADKTLSNQDHLFKLIIIGDTGKRSLLFNLKSDSKSCFTNTIVRHNAN